MYMYKKMGFETRVWRVAYEMKFICDWLFHTFEGQVEPFEPRSLVFSAND